MNLLDGSELLQLKVLVTLDRLNIRKLSGSLKVLLSLDLRDLLDLALEGHVRFLKVLDVLVLHLVHVDALQDL